MTSEGVPESVRQAAWDPEAWFAAARASRRSADALVDRELALWSKVLESQPVWKAGETYTYQPDDRATLLETAEIVRESSAYMAGARLLYGYALEAAFKGALIARNPPRSRDADPVRVLGLTGHDLVVLARRLGVEVPFALRDKHDARFLEVVLRDHSEAVIWHAKYPSPLWNKPPTDPLVFDVSYLAANLVRGVLDELVPAEPSALRLGSEGS